MPRVKEKINWAVGGATLFLLTVFGAPYANAQSITLTNPLGQNASFTSVMQAIFSFLFYDVAVPLCAIMVLIGAFQMMTAAGDPEKFSNGRKTLMYAAIGFAVAFIAIGAADIIKSIVGTGS